jgi:hypothetical protein
MGFLSGNKNTPLGQHHLCRSCTWAQLMTGYRDSDRLAVCTKTSPNMVIPFAMVECSGYSDRNRPDWDQMETRPGRNTSKTTGSRAEAPTRPSRKPGEDGEVTQVRFLRN